MGEHQQLCKIRDFYDQISSKLKNVGNMCFFPTHLTKYQFIAKKRPLTAHTHLASLCDHKNLLKLKINIHKKHTKRERGKKRVISYCV
jgi:hypothetical protein